MLEPVGVGHGSGPARGGTSVAFRVAAAQIKPRKAEVEHNLRRVGDVFAQAADMDPCLDVLVFPETVLSGYFLEGGVRDVAESRERVFEALQRQYEARGRPDSALDVVLGFYELRDGRYYNAALYATLVRGDAGGAVPGIRHVHHKFYPPTYGVFDEKRFVARGRALEAFDTRFGRAALLICEDVWHSITAAIVALKGAQVLYVISASPGRDFGGQVVGNLARWRLLLPGLAEEHSIFVVYSGLVGFEGGKGFTGTSRVIDPWGRVLAEGPDTEECLIAARVDLDDVAIARASSPLLADLEATLGDLVLELDAVARKPYRT